jgi:Na+-driven multidrug efflux pump
MDNPPTPTHADPFQAEPPEVPVVVVGRRKATLVNLFVQYSTLALMVIHGLLMVPLYLRYIDNGLYGAWLASGNVIYWAAAAQGGTTYLLAQRAAFYLGKRQMAALGEVIGSGMFLLLILSTLSALIAGAITPFVPKLLDVQGAQAVQLEWAFVAAIASLWLRLLCNGVMAVELGYQRPLGVGIITIVTGVIHLVVTVVFLLLGWGVLAIPLGTLVREILCSTALALHLVHTNRQLGVKLRITRASVRALMGLSTWTFLTFLNEAIDNGTMLLLVGVFLGKELVTVVTVSRAAWEILIVILTRFVNGVLPGLAHLNGEANRSGVVRVSNQMLLTTFSLLAIGMGCIWALNAPFVAIWGKPNLYAGDAFTLTYAGAAVFTVLNFGVSQVILSLGAIRLSSIVQTILNTVRLLAVVALLRPMGVLSVPVSGLIALVLMGWLLMRNWQDIVLQSRAIPWNGLARGAKLLLAAGVVGWGGSVMLHPTTWLQLGIAATIVAAIVSMLVLFLEPSLLGIAFQVLQIVRPPRKRGLEEADLSSRS